MTESEYKAIDKALVEAEKSDTPFLIAAEDELAVAGDANKIALNTHDFEIVFRVPIEQDDGSYKYQRATKEYKNVFVTPMKDPEVVKAVTILLPFYRGFGDGGVRNLTDEEKHEMFMSAGQEIYQAMYDLVAVFLDIDPDLKPYMEVQSVVESTEKIFLEYSEVANEADLFFVK